MKTGIFVTTALALLAAAAPGIFAAAAAPDLEGAATQLVGHQVLRDLSGKKGMASIRGTKALWIDLVVQAPEEGNAFSSLEADLKNTDLGEQLRDAKIKIMDPKRKSLALGLRPTLELMVLRSPKGAEGIESGFYVVMASALQDCTPLGGETVTMATWVKVGDPIAFSGDDRKDVDAIRASARACVKAFIDAAKVPDPNP